MNNSLDALFKRLNDQLPEWLIYTMGERPRRSLYQRFFCGLERRAGGRIVLGEGKTFHLAMARAIGDALTQDRESRP